MAAPRLILGSKQRSLGVADAVLAAIVVSVVGLMIVPLPTWLLDLLIATNLAISLALLLITLYVQDALKIAAFPTILLITTLVRMALSISSTRLILLQADAGAVIQAFGQFVVRGNYVVGGVIFLVLSIVQFIVIAKGSERVAEVGARFTLDAMPGKQMAIDAELRSGTIDAQEARRRRRELGRESQFYGAMDGAMKFVKGDTIASFLITLVNIVGGLAVGVGQRDMELGAALKRYGLLTIGDGLVSQIPSIVIAVAAGVLVTRVASEETGTPLGEELSSQLLGVPKALQVSALFVGLLALTPGLPSIPFLIISALLWVASRARKQQLERASAQAAEEPIQAQSAEGGGPRFLPIVIPWEISVAQDLEELLSDQTKGGEVKRLGLRSAGSALREVLFRELGVPLPSPKFSVDLSLPPRHIRLLFHEVPGPLMSLPDELPNDEAAAYLVDEASPNLKKFSADFIGISEVQHLLDQLEQISPATVRQVVPKPVTVTLLTDILRRLVEEGVSIRDLKRILEALSQVASTDRDPCNLAEFVRSQMQRQLTHELTRGAPDLRVHLLDPQIEDTIRSSIQRTSAGSFLTLAPAAGRDIISAIRKVTAPHREPGQPLLLLTQPDIRRFVWKLLHTDLPQLTIISYAELLPEIRIETLTRVSMRDL